jgi:DNA polymerase III sliding clamp (beta) subunit (PCNA family)
LNGALMVLRKGGLAMAATDGHRLAMVESSTDLPGVTGAYRALLPKKAMSELRMGKNTPLRTSKK